MVGCAGCAKRLKDEAAAYDCEVHVSTLGPLVSSEWTRGFTCPHGVQLWIEPTSEQRARWVADETP